MSSKSRHEDPADAASNPVELALRDPRWLALVDRDPNAGPFHDPAWAELLSECYGFRPFVYGIARHDELTAGLPLLEVRGVMRRRRWVALPFTDMCPIIGPSRAALVDGLERARSAAEVDQVEIRGSVGEPAREREVAKIHILNLDPDPDVVFKRFKPNVRQPIRTAEKVGVTVRRATVREELTRDFYRLHVSTRRRLGVPVQSRRFFELLWDRVLMNGGGYVAIASLRGEDIAASVFLTRGNTVIHKFGASDVRHLRARPNNALLWSAIKSACRDGYSRLDFGRSDFHSEGLRQFKSAWGADEMPLVYSSLGAPSGAHGDGRALALAGAVIRRSPELVCRASSVLYRFAA
jgi:CelD/BcsL family acetyltransferase involved in cellulose biosynthesis